MGSGRSCRPAFPCVALLLATAGAAEALVINPTFVNKGRETWTGDPARQAVIYRAIADWTTAILDDRTVNVTFAFTHAGPNGYLARWTGDPPNFYPVGTDIYPWTEDLEHTIEFNVDHFEGSYYLWWDPTPARAGDQPVTTWDALSVTRHELGHVMGFTTLYVSDLGLPTQYNRWTTHIAGTTFDPGGLNVTMAGTNNLAHVADSGSTAGDLMVPALVNNARQKISTIDLDMLELAHGYTIWEPGDFNHDFTVDGLDFLRWQTNFPTATGRTSYTGDANGDEAVDGLDFLVWQAHFQPGGSSWPVPEPASGLLLALAGLIRLRRQHS